MNFRENNKVANSWRLFISEWSSGRENMQADLELFNKLEQEKSRVSVLRLYSWQPKCLSYGYAQKIGQLVDLNQLTKEGWEVIRRPTGGGSVFHQDGEVSFAVITRLDNPQIPQGLIPSYLMISEIIVEALGELGINAQISKLATKCGKLNDGLCFNYPAEYEIVYRGRKIVGSAQKRGRVAMLQQGTIQCLELYELPRSFERISQVLITIFSKRMCQKLIFDHEQIESFL